jgi:hypothetical protein
VSTAKEWREVTIYYCDHCNQEAAPAPALKINGKWYGACCKAAGWREYELSTTIGFGRQAKRPLLPYEDVS